MKYLEEASRAMLETEAQSGDAIRWMVDRIRVCSEGGGTIYIIGNGGSLTTAEHFALDLRKYAGIGRAWAPVAPAEITAIGNDIGFEFVYAQTISSWGISKADLLIAFTFSARSRNIGDALNTARHARTFRIIVTGPRTTDRAEQVLAANIAIHVPSDNIRIVEDVHLAIAHSVAQGIREASQ